MTQVTRGYPCALRCGTILHAESDGVAFKLRSLRFATCHACAPRVVNATRIVRETARTGVKRLGLGLVQAYVPFLAPAARALLEDL